MFNVLFFFSRSKINGYIDTDRELMIVDFFSGIKHSDSAKNL